MRTSAVICLAQCLALCLALVPSGIAYAASFTLIGEGGDAGLHITRAYHISEDVTAADIARHMDEMAKVTDAAAEDPDLLGIIFDVVYLTGSCNTANCLTGLNAADSESKVADFLSDYLAQTPAAFNGLYRTGMPITVMVCAKEQFYWCFR